MGSKDVFTECAKVDDKGECRGHCDVTLVM